MLYAQRLLLIRFSIIHWALYGEGNPQGHSHPGRDRGHRRVFQLWPIHRRRVVDVAPDGTVIRTLARLISCKRRKSLK